MPEDSATPGALHYVDSSEPGYSRTRRGKRHIYLDTDGRTIRDPSTIARIDALAIPPAYTDVWICRDPRGHLQATGRDARGRKQYRYHPEWTRVRNQHKFDQLLAFGHALPAIRRRVRRDLALPRLCEEKVLAVVIRLLDISLIRVGTAEYARANKSYGLTTLGPRHVSVHADRIRFQFKGKSGIRHDVSVRDARVARTIRRCKELPGQRLFHYRDEDGELQSVDSAAVNAYLREAGQGAFTAKDYRTWAGSVRAYAALQKIRSTARVAAQSAVIKETARALGNTPTVCRTCYIHPAILNAYAEGRLPQRRPVAGPRELSADERRLLDFLETAERHH